MVIFDKRLGVTYILHSMSYPFANIILQIDSDFQKQNEMFHMNSLTFSDIETIHIITLLFQLRES